MNGKVNPLRRGRRIALKSWSPEKSNESEDILNRESPSDGIFATFVEEHMDRQAYLEAYPDVKASGIDPVEHWLTYGLSDGRFLAPNATVIFGDDVNYVANNDSWRRFTWDGKAVAVRIRTVRQSVIAQIVAQSRYDPAVVAAGVFALGNLRQFNRHDRLAIDVRRIFGKINMRPYMVLVMPFLCVGGAEKYAADLVSALLTLGHGSILVLVTDDTVHTSCGWESLSILAPFREVNVVLWREICGPRHEDPWVLALLLNALRPSMIMVNNSRVGLNMVARFGRGLSQFAKLYCTYYSVGLQGSVVPCFTRYARLTLPFSVGLTDNKRTAMALHDLWGGIPKHGIAVLPPRLKVAEESVFYARLMARQTRTANTSRSLRWVWVSRIEWFKGTAILAGLARMLSADRFDLFGPIQGDLDEMGLTLPNVTHCGTLADVSTADFTEYDGFVFTSLFEGMPNVVLEMSQHAIPMVLHEVGGLRDTFNDAAALFVPNIQDIEQSVANFRQALDQVAKLSPSEVTTMAEEARAQAMRRHAPDAYLKNVTDLLGGAVHHV